MLNTDSVTNTLQLANQESYRTPVAVKIQISYFDVGVKQPRAVVARVSLQQEQVASVNQFEQSSPCLARESN